ncbi:MAG TPA: hypothetical protein VGD77_05420 [Gemmatimonadaceae bacterium]
MTIVHGMMPTPMPHAPAGDADPWRTAVLEPLLRGLAHALANRATALDGLAVEVGEGRSPAGELAAELHAEVARLLAVHRDLRALLPDGAGEEPADLRDLAQEAASVAACWPAGSLAPAMVAGDAPAVRVVRSAAVRVIVGMLVHVGPGAPAPEVVLGGDEMAATLRVTRGDRTAPRDEGAPAWREQVAAQARAMGGEVDWGAGSAELRLPSLRALRAAATGQAT